jgi:hypothetical protein
MIHNHTISKLIQLIHTFFVITLIIVPLITSKYDLHYSILIYKIKANLILKIQQLKNFLIQEKQYNIL